MGALVGTAQKSSFFSMRAVGHRSCPRIVALFSVFLSARRGRAAQQQCSASMSSADASRNAMWGEVAAGGAAYAGTDGSAKGKVVLCRGCDPVMGELRLFIKK